MKQLIPDCLKNWLKRHAWFLVYKSRFFSYARKKNHMYVQTFLAGNPFPRNWNVFTKEGEDGILLHLFLTIGTTNKQFADIGSNDCINSNCANLAFHHQWNGLFVDADATALTRGAGIYKAFFGPAVNRFRFREAVVTPDTVQSLLTDTGCLAEPDLLCIDLDGNDYHIWQAIQDIRPRVVVTEIQIEKGSEEFIPPYQNQFEPYEEQLPKGASLTSMTRLAEEKGYMLAAANSGGYNLVFVRNDCMNGLTPLTPAEVLAAATGYEALQ
jgi:hypothetical protein